MAACLTVSLRFTEVTGIAVGNQDYVTGLVGKYDIFLGS